MVISCLVNIVQGGGGEVLPRFGMLENSPKTVKCVITFETDCSTGNRAQTKAIVSEKSRRSAVGDSDSSPSNSSCRVAQKGYISKQQCQ